MAKLATVKTTENAGSVTAFIESIAAEQKRKDSYTLLKLMTELTKEEPKMWGSSIIGFGKLIYTSPTSGRAVEWFTVGFSPRKANLTIYLMNMEAHEAALKQLGKFKQGGGCLYINKLDDINVDVLQQIIAAAIKRNSK